MRFLNNRLFYKLLEQFDDSHDIAIHGKKEHQEIINLMNDLTKMKAKGKVWENKVVKLKETVEHHVNDEEGKMFKEAKKVLTEEDALIIKEQMHYIKGKLLESYKKKLK